MDKYPRKILKYLNLFSSSDKPIPNIDIYHNFPLDLKTVDKALDFLNSNNYVCKHFSRKTGLISYYSTSKGKDYFKDIFKIKLLNAFKIIFLNILCPLLVAYLTARITTNNVITDNECCNKSSQATEK